MLLSIVLLPPDFTPEDCFETHFFAGQQFKVKDALPRDHFLSDYAGRQVFEFIVDEQVFPVAKWVDLNCDKFFNALQRGACRIRLRRIPYDPLWGEGRLGQSVILSPETFESDRVTLGARAALVCVFLGSQLCPSENSRIQALFDQLSTISRELEPYLKGERIFGTCERQMVGTHQTRMEKYVAHWRVKALPIMQELKRITEHLIPFANRAVRGELKDTCVSSQSSTEVIHID